MKEKHTNFQHNLEIKLMRKYRQAVVTNHQTSPTVSTESTSLCDVFIISILNEKETSRTKQIMQYEHKWILF